MSMPKRIVLCFDGTWNTPIRGETNVWRIYNALVRDQTQHVEYYTGVGVRGWIDQALGGVTGWGISRTIKEAYDFVLKNYTSGADIYLFGFSRGAYTARSLSGFLHLVGVIDDDKRDDYRSEHGTDLIEDAYTYYRLPVKESRNIITRTLQQRFFGATTRSAFKVKEKTFQFVLDGAKHKGYKTTKDGSEKNYESITIEFLGVWDTVGALGAPVPGFVSLTAPWVSFHDTKLSPNVKKAYQALALHELRKHFAPVFWTEKRQEQHQQTVEQAWFAGSHSNVGGGLDHRGLSDLSLQWMIEQARTAGLTFKSIDIQGDESEAVEISRTVPWRVFKPILRDIPHPSEHMEPDIQDYIYAHPSVRQRLERVKTQELLYHREPGFEKVDERSKDIPTRAERLDEIGKREATQEVNKMVSADSSSGVDLSSRTTVTIGPSRLKKRK